MLKKFPAFGLMIGLAFTLGCSVSEIPLPKSEAADIVVSTTNKLKVSETKIVSEPVEVASTSLMMDERPPLDELILNYLEEWEIDSDWISFVITDLKSGEQYLHNHTSEFIGASLYKLPLAMLYYDEMYQGKNSPEDLFCFDWWMKEEGGPIEANYQPGDWLELNYILEALIGASDNTAGHMLYGSLGGWEIMRESALKYTDQPAADNYYLGENYLTADYMGAVLNYIYDHPWRYKDLMVNMSCAEPEDFLNSVLYHSTLQKTGNFNSATHAAGLMLDGNPYSIVVMTDLGHWGRTVMGEINQLVYQYFNR